MCIRDRTLHYLKPRSAPIANIIHIGVPSGITQAIFSVAMLVVQSLTNSFGEMVIACNVIVDVYKRQLVYTPLNGSGLECVRRLLLKLGITHLTVVPEQELPDENFPTCPCPCLLYTSCFPPSQWQFFLL